MLKVDRSGAHPTWTGMEGRSGREVPLDDAWVHENFAPWFIQNVTDCFKHVPAGKAAASPEHRAAQTGLFGGFDLGGVPVAWQQGDNDCCVPYGAASASDVAQFRDAKGKLLSEHFAPLAGVEVADVCLNCSASWRRLSLRKEPGYADVALVKHVGQGGEPPRLLVGHRFLNKNGVSSFRRRDLKRVRSGSVVFCMFFHRQRGDETFPRRKRVRHHAA